MSGSMSVGGREEPLTPLSGGAIQRPRIPSGLNLANHRLSAGAEGGKVDDYAAKRLSGQLEGGTQVTSEPIASHHHVTTSDEKTQLQQRMTEAAKKGNLGSFRPRRKVAGEAETSLGAQVASRSGGVLVTAGLQRILGGASQPQRAKNREESEQAIRAQQIKDAVLDTPFEGATVLNGVVGIPTREDKSAATQDSLDFATGFTCTTADGKEAKVGAVMDGTGHAGEPGMRAAMQPLVSRFFDRIKAGIEGASPVTGDKLKEISVAAQKSYAVERSAIRDLPTALVGEEKLAASEGRTAKTLEELVADPKYSLGSESQQFVVDYLKNRLQGSLVPEDAGPVFSASIGTEVITVAGWDGMTVIIPSGAQAKDLLVHGHPEARGGADATYVNTAQVPPGSRVVVMTDGGKDACVAHSTQRILSQLELPSATGPIRGVVHQKLVQDAESALTGTTRSFDKIRRAEDDLREALPGVSGEEFSAALSVLHEGVKEQGMTSTDLVDSAVKEHTSAVNAFMAKMESLSVPAESMDKARRLAAMYQGNLVNLHEIIQTKMDIPYEQARPGGTIAQLADEGIEKFKELFTDSGPKLASLNAQGTRLRGERTALQEQLKSNVHIKNALDSSSDRDLALKPFDSENDVIALLTSPDPRAAIAQMRAGNLVKKGGLRDRSRLVPVNKDLDQALNVLEGLVGKIGSARGELQGDIDRLTGAMQEIEAEKTRLDASERHKEWCIEKRLGSLEVTEQQVDAEVHRAIQCTVMTAARRGCATAGASATEVAEGVGQLMAGKGPKFEQLKADVKTAFDKGRLEYAFSQEVRMENGMAQHGFFERVVAPGTEGLDARTCAGRLHDLADDDLCGTTWTV